MEPRSRSLESSAEPHPHNLATAPTQGISSRSHSWPKGAPCPAPSSPTPAVSKSTGRLAAAVETPLKGSIYRALLKQCGLYLQVPALQGGPHPQAFGCEHSMPCWSDLSQAPAQRAQGSCGPWFWTPLPGKGPVASAAHQPLQSCVPQAEGEPTAEPLDQSQFTPGLLRGSITN